MTTMPPTCTQDLKAKADVMERRLIAAEQLIAGLGSEKERWAADIESLEAQRTRLVGDCLLCSSFLSYTGKKAWGSSFVKAVPGKLHIILVQG
jgi:hypothetical protein